MGSFILRPGAPTLRGVNGFPPPGSANSVVVGSGAVWADGSDATYATIAVGQSDRGDALIPATSGTGVTGATLHVRCSQATSGSFFIGYLTNDGNPDLQAISCAFDTGFPAGGGVIEDFTLALTSDLSALVACLTTATPTLQFQVSSVGSDLTIYETWIVVTTSAPPVIPPLRQYPRSDGLGASSVRRFWPPPPTIQASNRRGPSAIL